jgi:20S proteasome alpha/beta subunit
MTLVVALEGRDGLILAADSRATIGDPRGLTAVNDLQQKLFKLSKYCGIAISGASELAARLTDQLIAQVEADKLEYTDDIVQRAYVLAKQEFTQWFGVRPWAGAQPVVDQRPSIIFVLAGYTVHTAGLRPRIYLLSSQLDFAPQLCPSGYMLAGVPQYATYLLHRFYSREMSVDNVSALAAYLIAETATQDPKVGGPIRIAVITPQSGYTELETAKVEELVRRNEEQSRRMRQFFFGGSNNGKQDREAI